MLFEAVWLETCKPGCGGPFAAPERPGEALEGIEAPDLFLGFRAPTSPLGRVWDPDGPEGPWERSWEALLESLGKAHLQRPQKSTKHPQNKWITFWGSNIATL